MKQFGSNLVLSSWIGAVNSVDPFQSVRLFAKRYRVTTGFKMDEESALLQDESTTTSGGSSEDELLEGVNASSKDKETVYHEEKRNGSMTRIQITSDDGEVNELPRRFPREKKKTLIAFLFLCGNFMMATVSLALTHERLPDFKPLPDIFLDNIIPQDWALDVSEILIMLLVTTTSIVLVLHKHRWIVFRRTFIMLGLLYMMRSITMYVTVLPKSNPNYYCSPKANSTNFFIIAKRAIQLMSGMGLSINGQQVYCGDFIFSGHTVILVTAYLLIQEYTPKKRAWVLHWAAWIASTVGVVMVLVARGHYTIDVIIAYFVTTVIFWIYHTLAHNAHLKVASQTNYLSRVWWFPLFQYMEARVASPLPNAYSFPWSKSHRSRRNF